MCAGLADDDAAAVSVCKPRSGGGILRSPSWECKTERERDVKVKGYGCGTGRYERHLSQSIVSSLVSFFTFYGSCWLSAFHFVLASRHFCKLVDGILLIKYISVQYVRKRLPPPSLDIIKFQFERDQSCCVSMCRVFTVV